MRPSYPGRRRGGGSAAAAERGRHRAHGAQSVVERRHSSRLGPIGGSGEARGGGERLRPRLLEGVPEHGDVPDLAAWSRLLAVAVDLRRVLGDLLVAHRHGPFQGRRARSP